ncbi:MAG: NUDIX hydrolase [Dorea sp.]|nr:NUDIX hydrolase [Dorea sp.]
MAEEVRRVKRELVHKGAVIDIYCDTMEFENGNTAQWDYIHHDGAAAVVPVTDEGKILMVRQYRNALERYTLEIPAGKLDDPAEKGIVCASRELEEETGYRSDKLEWMITLRTTVAFCNERIEIFVAHNLIPSKQNLDEDEYIDVQAYSIEELKAKIFAGEIEDSKTVSAILAYDTKYNRRAE